MTETIDDNISESSVTSENRHFMSVVEAFSFYQFYGGNWLEKIKHNHSRLNEHQKEAVAKLGVNERLQNVRTSILINSDFINLILGESGFVYPSYLVSGIKYDLPTEKPLSKDFDKVLTTLRQFCRDWSSEGLDERNESYLPLLQLLEKYVPSDMPEKPSVLVPGAGLGRLVWEVAMRGYHAQGNEVSYFMLLASNFILNNSAFVNEFHLSPFALSNLNVFANNDNTRVIHVPDVLPASIPEGVQFSMCAGEFLEVYSHSPNSFNCVMTCFFLDTAMVVVDYIETIYHILKPGGVWLNLGPLLHHFADSSEATVELTWEEIRSYNEMIGFEVLEESRQPARYTCNTRSMMRVHYDTVIMAARKPMKGKALSPRAYPISQMTSSSQNPVRDLPFQ